MHVLNYNQPSLISTVCLVGSLRRILLYFKNVIIILFISPCVARIYKCLLAFDLVVQVAQIDEPTGTSTISPVLTIFPANNDITWWTGFNSVAKSDEWYFLNV